MPGLETTRDVIDLILGLAMGLSIAACTLILWRHRRHWRG